MGKTDSCWLFRSLGAILLTIVVVLMGAGVPAGRLRQREAQRPSVRRAEMHSAEFPVLFYPGSASKKRDGAIVARGKGLRARFGPTAVVFDGGQVQVKLEFIGSSAVAPMTRAQIGVAIIGSPESVALNSNHALVDLLYLGFLRRGPDPGGLAGWKGQLDAGVPLANLINGFISSPEYIARF